MNKRLLRNQLGFTLIEISIVIAILSILAGIGILKVQDSRTSAQVAVVQNTASEVQRLIQITAAQQGSYPTTLDALSSGSATAANPFFTNIGYPVSRDWEKRNTHLYATTNLTTPAVYLYNPSTGQFSSATTTVSATSPTTINALQAVTPLTAYDSTGDLGSNYWFTTPVSRQNDAVTNPWSGRGLDFAVTFPEGTGNYTLSFDVMNEATHGVAQRAADGDWKLPAGYNNFNFTVKIDGTTISSGVNAVASDTSFQTTSGLTLSNVSGGAHTITLVWNNDSYNEAGHADANAMVRNLTITPVTTP